MDVKTILFSVIMAYMVYLLIRNQMTCDFLQGIADKAYKYDSQYHGKQDEWLLSRFSQFGLSKMYYRIIFSFKRLKVENFFPQDFANKINSI